MKLFAVTSPKSLGCTFLDWSVHFLSGQRQLTSFVEKNTVDLTFSPLNQNNAHGHLRNYPSGKAETVEQLSWLRKHNQLPIASAYVNPLTGQRALELLNIDLSQLTEDSWRSARHLIAKDYADSVAWTASTVPTVYVYLDEKMKIFEQETRSLERYIFSNNQPKSTEDLVKEFDTVFFENHQSQWTTGEIWDQRERRALDIRPLHTMEFAIDHTLPMLSVNSQDLFYLGESTIKSVMSYLDLDIDPNRLIAWRSIYNEWQQRQSSSLRFCINLDHILESIVNNWFYPLDDLTFNQEVIIQHFLIYKYNLNLKTWQLNEFPNNTQLLHQLLEDNIHTIEKIY